LCRLGEVDVVVLGSRVCVEKLSIDGVHIVNFYEAPVVVSYLIGLAGGSLS
jgi:hypothetical protein